MKKLKHFLALTMLAFGVGNSFAQINSPSCPACRPDNMIINGDFSAGSTNFGSDLTGPITGCNNGTYYVGNSSTAVCPSWSNNWAGNTAINPALPLNYLIVQSSSSMTTTDRVWFQNIVVTPGTDYIWEYWVAPDLSEEQEVPVNMFITNGVTTIQLSSQGGAYNSPEHFGSNRICGSWNSGANSGVWRLELRQTGAFGNQEAFGIDDIFFGPEENWPKTSASSSTVSSKFDEGNGIDTDDDGNVYVTGTYWDNTSFDGLTIDHVNQDKGAFLTKYSPCGEVIWVAYSEAQSPVPGFGWAESWDVAVDDDNNYVYITGTMHQRERFQSAIDANGSVCGNSINLPTVLSTAMFIAQYDFNGCLIAAQVFDYGLQMEPRAIAVNQSSNPSLNGNLYIGGTVQFSGKNVFMNDFTPTGSGFTWNWGQFSTGTGSPTAENRVNDITVNANSEVFMCGSFDKQIVIQSSSLSTSATTDGFVVKFTDNTSGAPSLNWLKQGGAFAPGERVSASSVYADPVSGNVFVCGYVMGNVGATGLTYSATSFASNYWGNGYYGALDPTTGVGLLHEIEGVNAYALPVSIETDAAGDPYMAGHYQGSNLFFPTSGFTGGAATPTGLSRNFVVKMDAPMVSVDWLNVTTTSPGAYGVHQANDMTVSDGLEVFSTGKYRGRMEFLNAASPDQLNSLQNNLVFNAFVTRNWGVTGLYRSASEGEEMSENDVLEDLETVGNNLKLYPNPTEDGLITIELVEFEEGAQLNIYDMSGMLVLNSVVNESILQLDLSAFKAGMYLVNYSSSQSHEVLKVTVK
ncbi:MAG: T9SS type A sorting domain-containing protein [Flavobacteriales bacterium]|nr:T9SS type A sorting domain-containing protein [Flavobacteriales bacterium]